MNNIIDLLPKMIAGDDLKKALTIMPEYDKNICNQDTALSNLSIDEKGASIQITSCDVTNKYDAEKKKMYTNFVIFGFDVPDSSNSGAKKGGVSESKPKDAPIDAPEDDDLPF